MKRLLCCLLCFLLLLSFAACSTANAPSGEGTVVDTYTSATETKYIEGKTMMSRELLEETIAEMLIGPGDYREMYTLGTCYNNVPLTSSIEFVYQPETMRFYGMADLGTEKLEHVKRNDSVSLGWVRMLTPEELEAGENYFSISMGIQVSGKAVVIEGDDPRYAEIMEFYLPTLTKAPADPEYIETLKGVSSVLEIIPERIVVRDTAFQEDGYGYMQIWRAEE